MLHLSEAEAYLRITVARASRRFPLILAMLGDGRLHLSGIAKLAPKLTEENAEMLLARATHQSKREIEKLVAEVAPKPDVPERTRKLRTRASREPNGDSAKVALRPDRVAEPAQVADPATRAPVTSSNEPAPRKTIVEPLSPARYKVELTVSEELRIIRRGFCP